MIACAPPTHLIFGVVKGTGNICHRSKKQVRRRTFHLKRHFKPVINIWKQTVPLFRVFFELFHILMSVYRVNIIDALSGYDSGFFYAVPYNQNQRSCPHSRMKWNKWVTSWRRWGPAKRDQRWTTFSKKGRG